MRRFVQRAAAGLFAWCGLVQGGAAQGLALRYHAQPEGLGNLVVTALVQSPDGRLWIGTENGLYRHDGARIERVDKVETAMPSRQINALASDGRHGLWVGTSEGLFHWHEDRFEPVGGAGRSLVSKQGQTLAATADGGALVAAEEGLYAVRRDAGSGGWLASPALPAQAWRDEPELAAVHAVMVEADGAWWLGCGPALCRWHAGELRRWGEREGVRRAQWAGLLRARDGALWVRSRTLVLRSGAQADAAFKDVTPPGLSQGTVHLQQPLVEDGDGRVMTHSDTGLLRWQAGRWSHFAAAEGLTVGGGVHAILVDRQQDVWLGTAGHGLAHWRGYRHSRHWTQRQGLRSDDVWAFAEEAPGRLWMGTGRGAALVEHAGGDAARLGGESGTQDPAGALVRDASGHLWMGTYSGELFRRRAGEAWQRVAAGLPFVMALLPEEGGRLWLGADNGGLHLMKPAGRGMSHELMLPPGMDRRQAQQMSVYAACRSPGGPAWFGTSAGLLMHDAVAGLTRPAVAGLPKDLVVEKLGCALDRTLWVGSKDNRVWRLRRAGSRWSAEPLPIERLGQRSVMALLGDSRGWLWVSTDDGVLVWNGRQWRRFGEGNGLVWSDCNQGSLYEDSAGGVWIGTSRGASQVLQPQLLFEPVQLELHITQVVRGAQAWPHDRPWAGAWSPAALDIAWTVPLYTNRAAQQVRYRLKGLSDAWHTTAHGDVSFAALPAGRYSFEAVAENADLGETSRLATLQFEILPPWWRHPWAVAGYGTGGVAFAVLVYRWRVRLLVRRQRELETLVGRRTAELEASYQQMRKLALTDGLTGAMNRRAIEELAGRELAHARRGEAPVAFVLLDVDHFKRINDACGHPAGDAVLQQLVLRLREAMRGYDAIGRWGGEEFLLVLPGLSLAQEEGRRRVEHLQRCVAEEAFDIGIAGPLPVTCSAGAVEAQAGATDTFEALIARADAALYEAKQAGRNRVVFAG